MQPILRFLFARSRPLWQWCAIAFPVALVPSVLIAAAAFALLHLLGADIETASPPEIRISVGSAIGLVFVAPAGETLLLSAMIAILSIMSSSRMFLAAASALIWGTFHGLFGIAWFFGTVWSFFVFSAGYVTWRAESWSKGFLAAAVPHALVNLTVAIALIVETSMKETLT